MGLSDFLRQKGSFVKALGLALCLVVRDRAQFVNYDALAAVPWTRYLFAGTRALALLILMFVFVAMAKRIGEQGLRRSLHGRRLMCGLGCCGALLETLGLLMITFGLGDVALVGSLVLGVGQSILIVAWVWWLLDKSFSFGMFFLAAACLFAGAIEFSLSFMQEYAREAVMAVVPLASGLMLCLGRVDVNESIYENSLETGGDPAAVDSARVMLSLLAFFAYSFVARHLTDLWMVSSSSESLLVFQAVAGCGTAAAGIVVLLLLRLGLPYSSVGTGSIIAFPLVMLVLYLSSIFGGLGSVVYVLPLFVLRKMLLVFPFIESVRYRQRGSQMRFFCLALLFVELGNLLQTVCTRLCDALQLNANDVMGVLIAALLVCIALYDLLRFLRLNRGVDNRSAIQGSFSTEQQAVLKEAAQVAAREAARESALDEMSQHYHLTAREREVLGYLYAGRNADYIAKTMVVAHSTAKTHISHIYSKTGLKSQQRVMDKVEEFIERQES